MSAPTRPGAPAGESVFVQDGAGAFVPSEHARGPWDPQALHGGAPAALVATALERAARQDGLVLARMTVEFLRPVPLAPLQLRSHVLRPGRRVRELAIEIEARGELVCRAGGLCVAPVPAQLPASAQAPGGEAAMPGPERVEPVLFALEGAPAARSFAASAMEMRPLDDPRRLGPARVWMRLRRPLVDELPASALASAAAAADFGNGISAALAFSDYLFINADLALHMQRPPRGEWIGLDARTLLVPGGAATAESVLHDEDGPFGRALQTLVVQRRHPSEPGSRAAGR